MAPGHAEIFDEIARAASEAETLGDLNAVAVPLLERALGAHLTAVVQFGDDGIPRFLAGNLNACNPELYFDRYFADDPVTRAIHRLNPPILITDDSVAPHDFEKSAAFNEYYSDRDVGRILCARMLTPEFHVPGSGLMGFFRSRSQPEYSVKEVRALARVLPAIESVARRGRRAEREVRARSVMSALLEQGDPQPRLAIDRWGNVLWISEGAERLLGAFLGARRTLPAELVDAARRLAAFAADDARLEDVKFSAEVRTPGGGDLDAAIRVGRTVSGEPFVVADLRERAPASIQERIEYGRLTRAESNVLECLRLGLSNAEIARRLFVSVPTVKTHVHRILQKLGVSSRLQAALVAYVPPDEPSGGPSRGER